jgi:hypothetical protein
MADRPEDGAMGRLSCRIYISPLLGIPNTSLDEVAGHPEGLSFHSGPPHRIAGLRDRGDVQRCPVLPEGLPGWMAVTWSV